MSHTITPRLALQSGLQHLEQHLRNGSDPVGLDLCTRLRALSFALPPVGKEAADGPASERATSVAAIPSPSAAGPTLELVLASWRVHGVIEEVTCRLREAFGPENRDVIALEMCMTELEPFLPSVPPASAEAACRRCGECEDRTHHWMADPWDEDDEDFKPGEFGCKHCEQRGNECPVCLGADPIQGDEDGAEGLCAACHGEGVLPLVTFELLNRPSEVAAVIVGPAEAGEAEPLTVTEAREKKICRICKGPADAPLKKGDSFFYNFGREYAHKSCLAAAPLPGGETVEGEDYRGPCPKCKAAHSTHPIFKEKRGEGFQSWECGSSQFKDSAFGQTDKCLIRQRELEIRELESQLRRVPAAESEQGSELAKVKAECERLREKLDTMWGCANYRLKYIDDIMRSIGFKRPDEKVEAHIGAACEFAESLTASLAANERELGELRAECEALKKQCRIANTLFVKVDPDAK